MRENGELEEAGRSIRPMLIPPLCRREGTSQTAALFKESFGKANRSPQAKGILPRSPVSLRNGPAFVSLPEAVTGNRSGDWGLSMDTMIKVRAQQLMPSINYLLCSGGSGRHVHMAATPCQHTEAFVFTKSPSPPLLKC